MKRIIPPFLLLIAACSAEQPAAPAPQPPPAMAGDAAQGKQLIDKYACAACHHIPGTEGPHGTLGPDLAGIKSRPIGGRVPNDAATMVAYLQNPPAIDPPTRMPPLGVTEEEAKHMTAYLFGQR
jgi:cytochrome c2